MGKVVRKLAPSLLPGEKDTRPYWQRDGRTVEGWAKHRQQVQDWKRRNLEKNRAYCQTQRDRMEAKYGKRKMSRHLDFIKIAEKFNESLQCNSKPTI